MDLKTWEGILEALEEAEDIAIARDALAKLDAAGGDPEKAGFIPWEKARNELERQDAKK